MKQIKQFVLAGTLLGNLFFLMNCGGDESETFSGEISGQWWVKETITDNCDEDDDPVIRTKIYQIVQAGDSIDVLDMSTNTHNQGTIIGNRVSWDAVFPEGDGTIQGEFNGTVSSDGLSVKGSGDWTWENTSHTYTCHGTTKIEARKLDSAWVNVAGKWSGSWASTNHSYDGTFSTSVIQNGSILTGKISVPYINMNNADLKGTVSGNKVTFGDIDDIIMFSGAIGSDTNSASGTYSYPEYSDKGTWQGTRSGGGSSGITIIDSFIVDAGYNSDITFDGSSFWILTDNNRIKQYDTNGVYIKTIECPGSYSEGLAWDGTNLINADDDWGLRKVFKLDRSGNSVIKPPGEDIFDGLGFDGTNFWGMAEVSNQIKIYKFTQSGIALDSFICPGSLACGMVCYGGRIWAASWSPNQTTIYKFNHSGTMLYSFTVQTSSNGGLTFDGTYLWYTRGSGNEISKLDTTGTVITSFAGTSNYMHDLAYDGTNLWVADATIEDARIYKLSTSGNILSSLKSPGEHPTGLTYHGGHLFVYDQITKKMYRINPEGENYFTKPTNNVDYLTYEGSNYWALDRMANTIYKFNQTGSVTTNFQGPSSESVGLVYVAPYLWTIGYFGFTFDKLYKLNLSGTVAGSYQSWDYLPEPCGLAYDGSHFWYIGKQNFGQIYKLYKLKIH